MKFIKNFILILLFIFPISNVFANVTHIDQQTFADGGSSFLNGIEFNSDGTKMFTIYSTNDIGNGNGKVDYINEYDLSTPFDISTHTFAEDSERCNLANCYDSDVHTQEPNEAGDMAFSSNGMHIFVINRGTGNSTNDRLYRYDLTKPFDV